MKCTIGFTIKSIIGCILKCTICRMYCMIYYIENYRVFKLDVLQNNDKTTATLLVYNRVYCGDLKSVIKGLL